VVFLAVSAVMIFVYLRFIKPWISIWRGANCATVLIKALAREHFISKIIVSATVVQQDRVAMYLGGNYRASVRRYTGPLVVTESRLIFVARTFVLERAAIIQLNEISSINLTPGFPNPQIELSLTDEHIKYPPFVIRAGEEGVASAEEFIAAAQYALARAHAQAQAPAAALSAAVEVNGYKIEPGANLVGANLSGAILVGANLTDADLFGAYLSGANLTNANLTNAHLVGAHLIAANLTRADLTRADLTGAILV
jgi:hypothetical protein